jgi:hypothetical protein
MAVLVGGGGLRPQAATYHVDYNYAAAGKSISFDGLNNPQKVVHDNVVPFKIALWLWMTNMHGVLPLGFSSTQGRTQSEKYPVSHF